ncbi:MAG TPA: HEAT repeat domain-containing protein, partial [bacterium]|nr:HEAT repeat domain-containing protein [bacterium]
AEVEAYARTVRSLQKAPVEECSLWEDLIPVATTLKYAAKVLDSLRRGDNVLLEGPPAVSKSSIPKWLGKLLGQDVVEATGSPDHSSAEMVGMPTIDEQGNLVFQQGYILKALREGSILILNEANLIPPEVLERLNSLLDDDRMLMVTENGAKVPVKADPNFRIIFTQNPAEMQGGRKAHSPALENKFRKIYLRDDFTPEELSRIVAETMPRLASIASNMVEAHAEALKILANDNETLTLRDLQRWGLIATALIETKTLSPEESILLGAELVYPGRTLNLEVRDQLQPVLDKLQTDLSEADLSTSTESHPELRQAIRKTLAKDDTSSLLSIYLSLAQMQDLDPEVYLGLVLKDASVDELQEILHDCGWDETKIALWIYSFRPPGGLAWLEGFLTEKSKRGRLNTGEIQAVQYAIKAIASLGARDFEHLKRWIVQAETHGETYVTVAAAKTLAGLGDPVGVTALGSALRSKNQGIRLEAAKALGDLGLEEGKDDLRAIAKLGGRFASIGQEAQEYLRKIELFESGTDPRPFLRQLHKKNTWAAEALLEFAERTRDIPTLEYLESFHDQWRIAEILSRISPKRKGNPEYREVRHLVADELNRALTKVSSLDAARLQDLLKHLPHWENHASIRATIRQILAKEGISDLEAVYQALAESEGMALDAWLGRIFQEAGPEELARLFAELNWDKTMAMDWLSGFKPAGAAEWLLKNAVEDPSSDLRRKAAAVLGQIGAKGAIPELRSLLKDGDEQVQMCAAAALGAIGAREATKDLRALFKSPSASIRREAVEAIATLGAKEAGEDLRLLLDDPDIQVSSTAAQALGQLGVVTAIEDLRAYAARVSPLRRAYAAEALGRLGAKEEALLLMRNLLQHQAQGVMMNAILGLGRWAPEEALIDLLPLLEADDPYVQASAASALGHLGSPKAVPDLMKALKWGDETLRMAAAEGLGRLRATEAIEALQAALSDKESLVQAAAALALGQIGAQDAVQNLQALLRDKTAEVRRAAAEALRQLSSGAPPRPGHAEIQKILAEELGRGIAESEESKADELQKLLNRLPKWNEAQAESSEALLRAAIQRALAKEGISDLRPVYEELAASQGMGMAIWLMKVFQNADIETLERLAQDLNWSLLEQIEWVDQVKPRAGRILLEGALSEAAPSVRRNAVTALGNLGDPEARPAVEQALGDSDAKVRASAAEALGHLGEPTARLALERALEDPLPNVRAAAATSLGMLGDPAARAALEKAVNDPNEDVQANAVMALGDLGDPASLTILRKLYEDPRCMIRGTVLQALGKLRGSAAQPILDNALVSPNSELRRQAALALGESGDHAARPALEKALEDREMPVREAAVVALGQRGDPASRPALERLLTDSTPSL